MNTYTLGELIDITKGKKATRIYDEFVPGALPYLNIGNLRDDPPNQFTDEVGLVNATEEDVVMAWDGSNAGTLGFGLAGIIGSTLARLRIRPDFSRLVDPRFLGWFLKGLSPLIRRNALGAAIPHVNRVFLEKIEVPVYSALKQQAVVSVLDKIDSLIQSRQRATVALKEFTNAQFFWTFGKKNVDSRRWPEVEIRNLLTSSGGGLRSGPFGSALRHAEFSEEGDVAVLGIDNFVDNRFLHGRPRFISYAKFEKLKQYRVYPRDVAITIMGTIGKTGVIPDSCPLAISTKHLAVITLDESKCNPFYLSYSLHSNPYLVSQIKARNRGAIMEGLNLDTVKKLKVRLPPIELQRRFENFLRIASDKLDRQIYLLDLLRQLLTSLWSKLFREEGWLEENRFLNELILSFSTLDLKNSESRRESLIAFLRQHKFDSVERYDHARDLIFELLDEGFGFEQVVERGKVKLKLKN